MNNPFNETGIEYKYCYDCRYYHTDNKCGLFNISMKHNAERHHLCVFHTKR